MEINLSKSDAVQIAAIRGRIDANNSKELEVALTQTIEAGNQKILIDLSGLDYISSSGLRVFLLVAKMLEKNGMIAICSMQPQVEQIFTISGFNNIFKIFGNREAAMQHLA